MNQLGSSIPGTNEWLPNKIIFDPNSSTLPAGNLSWSVYVKNFRNATFYWSGITTVITDEPAIGVNF